MEVQKTQKERLQHLCGRLEGSGHAGGSLACQGTLAAACARSMADAMVASSPRNPGREKWSGDGRGAADTCGIDTPR